MRVNLLSAHMCTVVLEPLNEFQVVQRFPTHQSLGTDDLVNVQELEGFLQKVVVDVVAVLVPGLELDLIDCSIQSAARNTVR